MTEVFQLYHVHELECGHDDEKLIGLFNTRAKADAALARVQEQLGFRDTPDGFVIATAQIDPDLLGWCEGFATASAWGRLLMRVRHSRLGLLALAPLFGCATPTPVSDENAAIRIAMKLCASQIQDPGIKMATKTKEGWDVILAPTGAELPHDDWWVVQLPPSGATSDTECFKRRGMLF